MISRGWRSNLQIKTPTRQPLLTRKRDFLGLFVFIILCLTVSAAGGAVTATSVNTWYQVLEKPSFNPPDWVFAPVWTTLYVLMGLSSWRIWRCRASKAKQLALAIFGIQLFLNFVWSVLFFGLQRIDLALVEIAVLFIAILANIALYWRIERLAGLLLLPYAAWVAFAIMLNISLWLLNGTS